jgi:hypothetical protein
MTESMKFTFSSLTFPPLRGCVEQLPQKSIEKIFVRRTERFHQECMTNHKLWVIWADLENVPLLGDLQARCFFGQSFLQSDDGSSLPGGALRPFRRSISRSH